MRYVRTPFLFLGNGWKDYTETWCVAWGPLAMRFTKDGGYPHEGTCNCTYLKPVCSLPLAHRPKGVLLVFKVPLEKTRLNCLRNGNRMKEGKCATETLFQLSSLLWLSSAMVHSYHLIENRQFSQMMPFLRLEKVPPPMDFKSGGGTDTPIPPVETLMMVIVAYTFT